MAKVWVRCSDGPEGEWEFDAIPRLGERVTLVNPHGSYEVVRVDHSPTQVETGFGPPSGERGIGIRLRLLDATTDPISD